MIGTLSAIMATLGNGPALPSPDAPRPGDVLPGDRLAALRRCIDAAHLQAGRPSYREISRLAGHRVSHTTVSKVIRCEEVPGWRSVELVVRALSADVEAVRALWVAVQRPTTDLDAVAPVRAAADLPRDVGGLEEPTNAQMGETFIPAVDDSGADDCASGMPRTTVFTLDTKLYMVGFYRYLARKIAAASDCVYITGEGVQDPEGESLHAEIVAAVRVALERGAHVVRVQTSPVVTDYWFGQLQALVAEFPRSFELRAQPSPVNATRVSLCAIDVDDPVRNVAEMMIQTPRYRGTRRLNLASTAVFIEGHPLLAQSFRDQILDLGAPGAAEHLTTEEAVARFFRGEYHFAYGVDMDRVRMTQRCATAMAICPVVLLDHKLVFGRAGSFHPGGVANLRPSAGSRVYGMLWKLSTEDLRALDEAEGERGYCGKRVTVYSLTGRAYSDVHVHVAVGDLDTDIADAQFLDRLLAAGRASGLPPEYQHELEARRPPVG